MYTSSKFATPDAASLLPGYVALLPWIEGYARLVEGWLDVQGAVWRPLIDAQAEWIRQWQQQSGWPSLELVSLRGGEELA